MKIIKKFTFATLATLAALAATLLFQTSITQADDNERRDRDEPVPVAIYTTFKEITGNPVSEFPFSYAGTFTSIIGTEVVSGSSRMDFKVLPGDDIFVCKFTFVRSDGKGTLVLSSVCVGSSGHGTWHVQKGTGRYKHFKAVGTETFATFPLPLVPSGDTDFERFAGIGTFDRHGD